jgi:hypothetical protein
MPRRCCGTICTLLPPIYGIMVAFFQFGMMLAEFLMGTLTARRGVRFGLSFALVWW